MSNNDAPKQDIKATDLIRDIATQEAEHPEAMGREVIVRKWLWLLHSSGPIKHDLVNDKGKMFCHTCGIDFAHASEDQIDRAMNNATRTDSII